MDFLNDLMTTPFRCPHCASDQVVKNGHNAKGKQQYRCKQCGKSGVLNPSVRYTDEQKEQIIAAYHAHRSLRGIERMFGVTRETVAAWLKKAPALTCSSAQVERYPTQLVAPFWYTRPTQKT